MWITVPALALKDIFPAPSTGMPLELFEICHVPPTLTGPTPPVTPVMPMVRPEFVMFVHDPCAAEKFTPVVPDDFKIFIQKPDPTFGVLGKNQLLVAEPFSVALPSPPSINGVVPIQLVDCTFVPPVSVMLPLPRISTPAGSLAI